MNVVKEIERINRKEIDLLVSRGLDSGISWHDEHKDSAYIFVGGLPFEASEGDIITVFSQYGEILDINLIRDKDTGKSKGFAFLAYLDQRSTVLAVDNFNGAKLAGRTLRVDHVKDYKPPSKKDESGNKIVDLSYNAIPMPIIETEPEHEQKVEVSEREIDDDTLMARNNIDPEDPMASFMLEKIKNSLKKEAKKKKNKKNKKDKKSKHKKKESDHDENTGDLKDSSVLEKSDLRYNKTERGSYDLNNNKRSSDNSHQRKELSPRASDSRGQKYSRRSPQRNSKRSRSRSPIRSRRDSSRSPPSKYQNNRSSYRRNSRSPYSQRKKESLRRRNRSTSRSPARWGHRSHSSSISKSSDDSRQAKKSRD